MRDALSILDKIVSFTNGELTYQNTLEHLNILDADYYFRLMDNMLRQDLSDAMLLYDDINRKGFEGDLVLNGFAEFMRNLLLSKDPKVAVLMEVVESFRTRYVDMAATVHAGYLVSALNILAEAEINYKSARNKKLHVELALIRLCYLRQAMELVSDGGKKKVTELRPLNFRVLTPFSKVPDQPKTIAVQPKTIIPAKPVLAPEPGPVLIIEEKLVQEKVSAGKMGSLQKIRERVNISAQSGQIIKAIQLTPELLQLAWAEFIEQLKVNRNPSAQSFEMAALVLKDEGSFTVITPNNLQQKFIDGERIPLSEFLQKRFHNPKLTYQVIVEQREDLQIKFEAPLNSRERFQQLSEQFPLIKELKDRLRLELDY